MSVFHGIILVGMNVDMLDCRAFLIVRMSVGMLHFFGLTASAIFTHMKSSCNP
jgi:hypothetical protein